MKTGKAFLCCICLILSLAMLAACGGSEAPVPSGITDLTAPPETDDAAVTDGVGPEAEPAETDPSSVPTGPEGIPLSPEEIQALLNGPDWEGVYRMDDLTAVIRDRQDDLAVLILLKGDDTIFRGFVQVAYDQVTYDAEAFSLSLSLDEAQQVLFIAMRGEMPSGVNCSGLYDRTDEDPSSFEASINIERLPASISETVSGGKVVMIYVDPSGRFSAMFPSVFTSAPSGEQPAGGLYLTERTGAYTLLLTVEETEWASPEDAAAAVSEEMPGAELAIRDGCLLARVTEGGTASATLFRVSGSTCIRMTFSCPADSPALESYLALLAISDS